VFATLAGGFPWAPDAAPDPDAALRAVLRAQAEAGLGLLSDGRVHALDGRAAANWATTAEASAQEAPGVSVKIALLGPWSARSVAAEGAAAALGALAAAGCHYVEIHEPAAALPGPGAGPAAFAAFAAAHETLLRAMPGGVHASLAITGGNADHLPPAVLFGAPYASYLFDLVDGPENWRLVVAAPGDRGIILGVVDATGRRRIGLEEITYAVGYAASTGGRGRARIGIAPSGSLAPLTVERARAVLDVLGGAVEALTGDREALLDRLDPRAIDARTAALGHEARRAQTRPRPADEDAREERR
jgi:hypothetical protein